jgi:hypothetical protein
MSETVANPTEKITDTLSNHEFDQYQETLHRLMFLIPEKHRKVVEGNLKHLMAYVLGRPLNETVELMAEVEPDELRTFKAILEANGIDPTPQSLKTHLEENNFVKELLVLQQIQMLQTQSDMPKPPIPIAVVNGQLGFLSFSKLAFEAYQQELIGYVAGLKKGD